MNAFDQPDDSSPMRLAAGVWRLRTHLDGHPLGTLNSYLLSTTDGIVLIDTPWAVPSAIEELEAGISEVGYSPADVHTVLVTHYHEDHSGAAGWFRQRYGSRIAMHVADVECLRGRRDARQFTMRLDAWLNEIGADADARTDAHRQFRTLSAYSGTSIDVDLPLAGDQLLELDGRRIHAVHTPGHTPGSLSYFDEESRFLFSGDHVFDRRHSNAVKRPFSVERPIAAYWESSRRLLALEPAAVLPGHDGPIADLASRMRTLAQLRDAKLAEASALARGGTAWELAAGVRRSRPWASLTGDARLAATGELLGYLYECLDAGLVTASGSAPVRWTAPPGALAPDRG